MKKIFILCLTFILTFGLVACSGKVIDAQIPEEKIGTYYDENGQVAVVSASTFTYKDITHQLKTNGKEYFIFYPEEKNKNLLSFANENITIENFGTFTKRTLAKLDGKFVGNYFDDELVNVSLDENALTLLDTKHNLFEDSDGIYYLSSGQKQYISFNDVIDMHTIIIGEKTYVKEGYEVTGDGELTKLIKTLYEKGQNFKIDNLALEVSFEASAKETVLTGEKTYKGKIDSLLANSGIVLEGNLAAKSLDVTDIAKLEALILSHMELNLADENKEYNAHINISENKLVIKTDEGSEETIQEFSKDIPTLDDLKRLILNYLLELNEIDNFGDVNFDSEDVIDKVAQLETLAMKYGVKFSDVSQMFSKTFAINEQGLMINLTKSDLTLMYAVLKALINSKFDEFTSNIWVKMDDEAKEEYENDESTFKSKYRSKINGVLNKIEDILYDITITSFKVEVSFETLETLVDIDITIPGKDISEVDGNKEVTCTYNKNFKIKLVIKIPEQESDQHVDIVG